MSVWIVISFSGLYLKNKKDKLIVLMSPFAFCVVNYLIICLIP